VQHCCNEPFLEQDNLVLDLYYTELDVRALEEALGSIERLTSAMATITSNTSTGCSISSPTLTQTTTAPNNQIAGFSDGQPGRSILVKGCGAFPQRTRSFKSSTLNK
jgi:hypothetical protein